MSLYCTRCSNPVPEGRNQCGVCNNGFISQLACLNCRSPVERGLADCSNCSSCGRSRPNDGGYYPQPRQDGMALVRSSLWGDEMSDPRRSAGQFGAISDVNVPDNVQEFLGDLLRNIQSLLQLASKLAYFAPTDNTRACIRDCRSLAIRLQEEYEIRRGSK